MITGYQDLTEEQRHTAVQTLTALWAFTESGLGGVMHALKIPFTGLVVGGMAIIIISIIARINLKQLLKATMIVLIIKAMVSPHTPFTAYIAVSFQAVLGYALFSFLPISFFSILLLSSLAMLESRHPLDPPQGFRTTESRAFSRRRPIVTEQSGGAAGHTR